VNLESKYLRDGLEFMSNLIHKALTPFFRGIRILEFNVLSDNGG